MKVYCQILNSQSSGEKSNFCVANTPSPKLLAVSDRSIAVSCSEKYQSDQHLRDDLGATKGIKLVQFDGVFSTRQKGASVFNKVFLPSMQELYEGNSCLILNAVANCRE